MHNATASSEIGSTEDGPDALAVLAPVSHAIFRVARLHKTMAGRLLRQTGLYPGQELVMMQLWADGPQRQVDLVQILESEAPTVTRTIKRLEKASLVSTSRNPADARSIIVEATEASRPLRRSVEQAWTMLESWTVDAQTEQQHKDVLDALTVLEANLLGAERGANPVD